MKKVVIVDDHLVARTGIKEIVNSIDNFQVCGLAEDSVAGFVMIKKLKPDLAIIDLSFKDGYTGFNLISKVCLLDIPILVISCHDERYYAKRSLEEGANGYIMKTAKLKETKIAIKKVASGKFWVSDNMVNNILSVVSSDTKTPFVCIIKKLTTDDFKIFSLLDSGLKSKTIAERLGANTKSIQSQISRIKKKLKLSNTEELYQYAIEWKKSEP